MPDKKLSRLSFWADCSSLQFVRSSALAQFHQVVLPVSLFSCPLETLDLIGVDVRIMRKDIHRMGIAWPQLKRLKLGLLYAPASSLEAFLRPTLRVGDLRLFAKYLPNLSTLRIPIDASDDRTLSDPECIAGSHLAAVGGQNPHLTLSVTHCPIGDSFSLQHDLAAFLMEFADSTIVRPVHHSPQSRRARSAILATVCLQANHLVAHRSSATACPQ